MHEFFQGKVKEFISGAFVGVIAGINFLFDSNIGTGSIVGIYMLKFFGTCIIAFCSGILTMAGKDLWDWIKVRYRERKNKKNSK